MTRRFALSILLGLFALSASPVGAQDRDSPPGFADLLKSVLGGNQAEPLDQAELEARFADQLTSAVLVGNFRITRGGGPLSEPREERYTIEKVQKIKDDIWMFTARIQYGQRDVAIPLPIRVVWAGDTPVITVTDFAIPGIGTYSARLVVYRGLYGGTWHGRGYGGTLAGEIKKIGEE